MYEWSEGKSSSASYKRAKETTSGCQLDPAVGFILLMRGDDATHK